MNTPGLGSTTTPSNSDLYASQLESDKRSVLEQVIRADLLKNIRNVVKSNPIVVTDNDKNFDESEINEDEPTIKIRVAEEYAKIFGDDDHDDSDEIINLLAEKAKAEYKRQREFKRKNPHNSLVDDIFFKKPKAKRARKVQNTTRSMKKSLEIMNNFRQKLRETNNHQNSQQKVEASHSSASAKTIVPFRKSSSDVIKICMPCGPNQTPMMRIYPAWKTTATYTPIFASQTNPNWKNINKRIEESIPASIKSYTPKIQKMYTPGHIFNWMGDTKDKSNNFTTISSSKSNKSTNAICNSELIISPIIEDNHMNDNDNFLTPPGSPLGQSTPIASPIDDSARQRKSVVRFKDSSPEQIPCSNYEFSTISSPSLIDDGNADFYHPSPLSHHKGRYEIPTPIIQNNYQISPLNYQGHYQVSPPVNQGNDCKSFEKDNSNLDNCQPFIGNILENSDDLIAATQNKSRNELYNDISDQEDNNVSPQKSVGQQPFFFNNFVRKLNDNVHNNYRNVSVKYSMKVKYF